MKRYWYAAMILALFLAQGVDAQTVVRLLPESRFRIEGTTNVNRFTCSSSDIQGRAVLGDDESMVRPVAQGVGKKGTEVSVRLPVERFDCGKKRMNTDMHAALKAAQHPHIRFDLTEVRPLGSENGQIRLVARGLLTIAGERRMIEFPAVAREIARGTYRLEGSQSLKMTAFGIKPPTAALGMIHVRDEITVRFDLVGTTSTTTTLSSAGLP